MKDQELSLYRALLDNLQDGICIYNETGDFVYVNNAIVNIRGIPRQQYLTMNVHDLYQTRYINICIFDMVLERQGEVTALQRYSSRGKVVRTRLCTGSPIFDSDGSV